MSLLWKTAMEYGEYHDPEFDGPRDEHPPAPSGGRATCGNLTPDQEQAIKEGVTKQVNDYDLGGGRKGWPCSACTPREVAHDHERLFVRTGDEPEPDHWGDYNEWHDRNLRDATPAEREAKGEVFHTSTPEGIKVNSEEECHIAGLPDHHDAPHVSVQYGEEHHPPGTNAHRWGALYGLTGEGLELWAN